MLLEACVETFEEARIAREKGAHRLELCSHLDQDGLTPDNDLIKSVCTKIPLPVMVMVRPRAGSFVFSEVEIQVMEQQIAEVKATGAAGIVLGLLNPDGGIDISAVSRLAKLAAPLPVTFHKAIDLVSDPVSAVEQLCGIEGITRILTSGGKPTAKEGAATIRDMIEKGGKRITIIAAGRVTIQNREEIGKLTGATELHGRKIVGELEA